MFGYVTADLSLLSGAELGRYRSVYCGLCRTIGARHGQKARLTLTYDMAFLVLLLSSLYEPEEQTGRSRCTVHPVHRRDWSRSAVTEYAADLNVALAYWKCMDDWQDERRVSRLAAAKALEPRLAEIRSQWPRQCRAVEENLSRLSELEQAGSDDLDRCCRVFGALMGELFVWREDRWQEQLYRMGERLGQFIYLMDAVLDREADERRGRYNPVSVFEASHGALDPLAALTMLMGDAADAFERLPLEQDLSLLRNILYSGVWVRWAQQAKKTPPKEEEQSK